MFWLPTPVLALQPLLLPPPATPVALHSEALLGLGHQELLAKVSSVGPGFPVGKSEETSSPNIIEQKLQGTCC